MKKRTSVYTYGNREENSLACANFEYEPSITDQSAYIPVSQSVANFISTGQNILALRGTQGEHHFVDGKDDSRPISPMETNYYGLEAPEVTQIMENHNEDMKRYEEDWKKLHNVEDKKEDKKEE